MTPESFTTAYTSALATQIWANVEPLISDLATITFSTGKVLKNKSEIKEGFEINFKTIENEEFSMKNVNWLLKSDSVSVYTFEYHWNGTIRERPAQGSGVGTAVIIYEKHGWKLLTEHLSN